MTRTMAAGARSKRKMTRKQRKASFKNSARMIDKEKDVKASEALRSIFYGDRGHTQRIKLGKGYGILSYLTYSLHLIKCYLTIIFYFSSPPSFVYLGNSGFLNNKKELKKLWDGIPLEFLNSDDLNSRGFKRIDFTALIEVNGGKDFTIAILKLLKPLFSTYSVEFTDPMHLIVSSGNTDPYHQDVVTGCRVYNQSYQKDKDGFFYFGGKYYLRPANGIRVLIDLGSLSGEHDSRQFSFKEPEISLNLKGLELCSPDSVPKSIKTLIPKDLLRKALS